MSRFDKLVFSTSRLLVSVHQAGPVRGVAILQVRSFNAPLTATKDSAVNNTITNSNVTNVSGNGSPNGYQFGISDFGNRDNIVNNKISGNGYDPLSEPTPGSLYGKIDTTGSTSPHTKNNK